MSKDEPEDPSDTVEQTEFAAVFSEMKLEVKEELGVIRKVRDIGDVVDTSTPGLTNPKDVVDWIGMDEAITMPRDIVEITCRS